MCVSIIEAADGKTLTITVHSEFMVEDAGQIAMAIGALPPEANVDVDFRDAGHCEAPALERLADLMRSGRARIAVHGISGHLFKLLRYLGMPPEPAEPRT